MARKMSVAGLPCEHGGSGSGGGALPVDTAAHVAAVHAAWLQSPERHELHRVEDKAAAAIAR